MVKIPLNKNTIGNAEKKALNKVFDSGYMTMGKVTKEFEKKFAEHLGVKLAKFLLPYKIINGVSNLNAKDFTHLANGPECLAAQLVKRLKTGDICDMVVGNVYLYPRNPYKYDAEYIYTLYPKTNEPTYVAIYKNFDDKVVFVGTPDKLIKKYDRQRDKSISSTSS